MIPRRREGLGVNQGRLAVNWDLVGALARRDLKVRYRQSVLGFAWSALHPLLMMLVLHVVFSEVFRFKLENYPVYALTGIMYWNFVSQTITHAMASVKGNAVVMQQMPVKPVTFPLAAATAGAIHVLLELGPLLAIVLLSSHHLGWGLVFLPFSIGLTAVFVLGVSLALGPLAVGFGDVTEFVGVLLRALFYLTPVFYPLDIVPEKYLPLVLWNPLRYLLETFRQPIYDGGMPDPRTWGVAAATAFVTFAVGWTLFRRAEARLAIEA